MDVKSLLAVFLLVTVVSGFSIAGISHFRAGLAVNASDALNVQLDTRNDGQASFSDEKVHTNPYSAKLVIPVGARRGSCAIALYPYNGTLNSLSTFSIFASYVNAVPSFVIYLDKDDNGVSDSILLSDYQLPSNGEWKISTGGKIYGWTEANYQLSNYGTTWKQLDAWKNDYGNVDVLYVGIALEYWAVDPNGYGEPLYADELMLNGATPTYASGSIKVQLDERYYGQASFTDEKVHTSPNSAKLVIPKGASQGSFAIALYPYNKPLSALSTFSVFASFFNATPRFVIYLDKNSDGVSDSILLSDYQLPSNGEWKITTGGERWGWTESNLEMSVYGLTWKQLDSWKTEYGNVTVLYLGITLEYWAVDPNGFGEPLYADELILDGVMYNILSPSSAPFKISGYILDSNGRGISGAYIIFNNVSTPSVSTDYSGYYVMPAPAGTYHINVWPPFDSNYINYDEPGFVVGSDMTKNITLSSGCKVSGYISNSSGTPMVGASVLFYSNGKIYGSGWFTNNLGYYFLSVPAGTYTIDAHPQTRFNPNYPGPVTDFPTYYEYNFTVNRNTVKNITVGGFSPSPSPTNNSSDSNSWPMFHKDLAHSGYSGSSGPLTNQILWKFQTGSSVESSPAVVDGVVYFGALWNGKNGFVYAINATTGSKIWQFATNSGVESSPAVVDGVVYIGSYIGQVYALNAANGALIWSFNAGGSVFPSPAVVNGTVYVGSANGYMYALNATNGSPSWSYQTNGTILSSPAVVDDVVYFGSEDHNMYALRASDGSEIWHYTTGSYIDTSPAVVDGMVYFGSRDGYVYALKATSGSQIWSFSPSHGNWGSYYYSTPAVADGVVYVGGYDSYIYALNAANGGLLWEFRTGGYIFSSPVVAGGVVYVGSFDCNVYALDARTGGKIWSYQTGDKMRSSCAVVNGVVYVGSCDGYLYAFGSSGAQSTSPATPIPTASSTEPTSSYTPSTSSTPPAKAAPAQISDLTDADAPSSEGSVVDVNGRLSDDTPLWGWVVTAIAVGIIVTVLGICCIAFWEIRKTQKI
jgi:outer membrane protein assembly factor BamB